MLIMKELNKALARKLRKPIKRRMDLAMINWQCVIPLGIILSLKAIERFLEINAVVV